MLLHDDDDYDDNDDDDDDDHDDDDFYCGLACSEIESQRRFETWGWGEGGGSSYTKPSAYPYSNFPKCPMHGLLIKFSKTTFAWFVGTTKPLCNLI